MVHRYELIFCFLLRVEGKVNHYYCDHLGHVTMGYGHRVFEEEAILEDPATYELDP